MVDDTQMTEEASMLASSSTMRNMRHTSLDTAQISGIGRSAISFERKSMLHLIDLKEPVAVDLMMEEWGMRILPGKPTPSEVVYSLPIAASFLKGPPTHLIATMAFFSFGKGRLRLVHSACVDIKAQSLFIWPQDYNVHKMAAANAYRNTWVLTRALSLGVPVPPRMDIEKLPYTLAGG
jgi:hypothetical protein